MQRGMHAAATVVSPAYSPESQDVLLAAVKDHPFVNAAQYAEIESYLKGERSWLAEKSLTVLNEVGMCMDVGVSLFRKGVRTTRDALGLQEIISDRNIDNATAVLEIFGVVKGLQKTARSTLVRPKPVRPVASTASGEAAALPAPKMVKHHIFNKFRGQSEKSSKYRDFFKKHKINVDDFTIEMPESMHRSQIHATGNNWTTKWKSYIDKNPNATTKDVYQFAGTLMDEYGVAWKAIVKYRS